MSTEKNLHDRSGSKCELCASENNLSVYEIPSSDAAGSNESADKCVLVCETCLELIKKPDLSRSSHWRCLNDSMWTPVPAVQVMAWRILDSMTSEGWPQDMLEMLYLEEDVKEWAEAGSSSSNEDDDEDATIDSNGATLNAGDTVTLIKDLVVKGANFTAKRGTVVKNISLTSNPKHIEGRVNGTRIVLVSAFLKKA